MAIRIQDLVLAACTRVEEVTTATQAQLIFQVADAREAKLAFDLLKVYGIEAKLYNENGASRLYITPPKASFMANQSLLAEALAYAASLQSLKQRADQIATNQHIAAPDYSISFVNTPLQDKQIIMHLVSAHRKVSSAGTPAGSSPYIVSRPAAQLGAARPVKPEDDLFSGPEIMRPKSLGKFARKQDTGPDTLWKQFKTYMKGNAMAAGLILGACFAVLIIGISLFVISKAFLCPDLAVVKKQVWYCTYHDEE